MGLIEHAAVMRQWSNSPPTHWLMAAFVGHKPKPKASDYDITKLLPGGGHIKMLDDDDDCDQASVLDRLVGTGGSGPLNMGLFGG